MPAAISPLLSFVESGMVCAEIGVQEAKSSVLLLEQDIKLLYAIDPWAPSPYYLEGKFCLGDFPVWEARAMARLKPYINAGRVIVLKMGSTQGAGEIAAQSLDFAFIDGNHTFSYVTTDIQNYWIRVKPGGILSGHDYVPSAGREHIQVKEAVDTWIKTRPNLKLEKHGDCWMIRKPL